MRDYASSVAKCSSHSTLDLYLSQGQLEVASWWREAVIGSELQSGAAHQAWIITSLHVVTSVTQSIPSQHPRKLIPTRNGFFGHNLNHVGIFCFPKYRGFIVCLRRDAGSGPGARAGQAGRVSRREPGHPGQRAHHRGAEGGLQVDTGQSWPPRWFAVIRVCQDLRRCGRRVHHSGEVQGHSQGD